MRAKPLAVADDDTPLKKLLTKRFNEALAETQLTYKCTMQGVPGEFSPIDAGRRLQKAAVELFAPKKAVSFLNQLLQYANSLEKTAQAKLQRASQKSPMQALQLEIHRARQFRLEIEIQKLKLETGVK
jgi:hypothetical protein